MIIDYFLKQRNHFSKQKRSHFISFTKAVSWRIVGTLDTIIISYFITGRWNFAISIGMVEVFTKVILFYLHDRAWEYLKNNKNA